MEAFLNFLGQNYIWFLLITVVLLFALIGYIIDSKNPILEQQTVTHVEPQKTILDNLTTIENKPITDAINLPKKENSEVKSETPIKIIDTTNFYDEPLIKEENNDNQKFEI